MIISFDIKNFGSIRGKQTLSFEAEKTRHLEDFYVTKIKKLRLLKIALIYGANASGKTTILKALDFLRDLVLEPVDKKTGIRKNTFNRGSQKQQHFPVDFPFTLSNLCQQLVCKLAP